MRKLAEDMLDLITLLGGELTLEPEEVDLCAIVREVSSTYEEKLATGGSVVSIRCDSPTIGRWDRRRMKQLVACLVDNAIKFGETRPIEIRVSASAKSARLEVEDHGLGIPDEFQPHVFDLYSRAVSERRFGGFGVGLYVARRIAEASGGTLHVVSELGAGSTFTLDLARA